jgi:hypothetical protein
MERLYLYSAAMAIIGLSIGSPAALSVFSGDRSVPLLLMTIGGVGMVATAGYEVVRCDPAEFEIPGRVLFVVVGAACLSLLGTVLSVV